MKSLLFAVAVAAAVVATSAAPVMDEIAFIRQRRAIWDYDLASEHGPDKWDEQFPKSCGGKYQSPINIPSNATVGSDALKNWTLSLDPKALTQYTVTNNQHTIQVDATLWNKHPINVTFFNGTANETYYFLQFHLHWGASNTSGSEHTVDNKSYAGEFHMVHVNAKYGNVSNAINYGDGLLVIGVFLQEGNTTYAPLAAIAAETTKLSNNDTKAMVEAKDGKQVLQVNATVANATAANATASNSTSNSTTLSYMSFFPSKLDYWTYRQGSLTTPTCNEAVTWVVMKTPVMVTPVQIALLRAVKDTKGHTIAGNFRPTQPLNGRVVYDSTKGGK